MIFDGGIMPLLLGPGFCMMVWSVITTLAGHDQKKVELTQDTTAPILILVHLK